MSLEMKAARYAAGSQQGLSWSAVTGALGKGAGWLAGVLGQGQQVPRGQQVRKPGVTGAVQRFLPGGQSGWQDPTGGMTQGDINRVMAMGGTTIACPKGYRPNKTSYHLKDGTYVEKGTKCVKTRRRNPLNPRANSRAMSRLNSAKNAAKDLNRVTIRKKNC